MSRLLSEKCSACMEDMVFNEEKGMIASERVCCQKSCDVYSERVKTYKDGVSQQNPCFFCSKYEHCVEQLKCGFLS